MSDNDDHFRSFAALQTKRRLTHPDGPTSDKAAPESFFGLEVAAHLKNNPAYIDINLGQAAGQDPMVARTLENLGSQAYMRPLEEATQPTSNVLKIQGSPDDVQDLRAALLSDEGGFRDDFTPMGAGLQTSRSAHQSLFTPPEMHDPVEHKPQILNDDPGSLTIGFETKGVPLKFFNDVAARADKDLEVEMFGKGEDLRFYGGCMQGMTDGTGKTPFFQDSIHRSDPVADPVAVRIEEEHNKAKHASERRGPDPSEGYSLDS